MSRHHSRALRYFGLAVFLVALCAAAPVFAQIVVGVHAWSAHEPRAEGSSNDNPGLYVRHGAWQAGVYRNSVRRPSAYVVRLWDLGPVELSAGLVTGYQRERHSVACSELPNAQPHWVGCWKDVGSTPGRIAPFAALSAPLPAVLGVTPRITWVPRAGGSNHVLHLSFERPL